MKELKELKFEELTKEQKLGMAQVVYIRDDYSDRTKEYIFDMIRNHMLGGIWIQYNDNNYEKLLAKVKLSEQIKSIGNDAFYNGKYLTICTTKGSYAERYALENSIKLEYLSNTKET